MSFEVAAESYDRFMGRYAVPLATRFADFAEVRAGQRVVDVGCGPGALTAELVGRLGADSVTAIDPQPSFVTAVQNRCPGVDVRAGVAEALPFDDSAFDVALAQLVVHFMNDPVAGLREMGRVAKPGGIVAACVWDHSGNDGPLSYFWRLATELDPDAPGEAHGAGAREGHLAELCEQAGLEVLSDSVLTVRLEHASFEEWWEPYNLGVGPAGDYVAAMDPDQRERLRAHCAQALAPAPFTTTASAWTVRARPR